MTYEIEMSPYAARSLRKLAPTDRRKLARAIDTLRTEARPLASRRLRGTNALYRLRVGSWRIVYSTEDHRLLILVVLLGHRREIYDRLRRLQPD